MGDPLNDGISKVEYLDNMGSDLDVVNAARVSMNKEHTELTDSDKGLIEFLAENGHWTPFAHPQIKFRIKMPLFVAREWFRHEVGFCVTGDVEVSFERTKERKNGVYTLSISELYKRWNQEAKYKYGRHDFPKREKDKTKALRVLNTETDEFENGSIRDIIYSGSKDVFEVTLENGKKATMTKDHRVFTGDVWEKLEDSCGLGITSNGTAYITKQPEIACNGIQTPNADRTYKNRDWLVWAKEEFGNITDIAKEAGCSYHTIRKWLKIHDLKFDPKLNLTGSNGKPPWNKGVTGYKTNKVVTEEQKEAIRNSRSGSNSNFWKGGVTSDRGNIGRWTKENAKNVHERNDWTCQLCGSNRNLVAHHIIPVYADSSKGRDLDNLTTLCDDCHKYIHSNNLEEEFANKTLESPVRLPHKKGRQKTTAKYSKIVKVEYKGVKDVYDISVNHPSHNFVGNGVVLHNSRNEVSRRYVKEEPELYIPQTKRERPEGVKQGSCSEEQTIRWEEYVQIINARYRSLQIYNDLLDDDWAPELARMFLPMNTYTEFIETGSLYAYARLCTQRLDLNAQKEIMRYAQQVSKIMSDLYPISWFFLVNFY